MRIVSLIPAATEIVVALGLGAYVFGRVDDRIAIDSTSGTAHAGRGFLRARVDGQVIDVDAPPPLSRQKMHNIEAVIELPGQSARIATWPGNHRRVADPAKRPRSASLTRPSSSSDASCTRAV